GSARSPWSPPTPASPPIACGACSRRGGRRERRCWTVARSKSRGGSSSSCASGSHERRLDGAQQGAEAPAWPAPGAGMSVLVIAEHLQGRVRDVTYEVISAGRELGGPVTVAVIGGDLDVSREGVDEIVHVRVEREEFENDVYQAALESLLAERRPDVVL